MRFAGFISLVFLISCTHHSHPEIKAPQKTLAHASIAQGRIKAFATKNKDQLNVCFNITIQVKNMDDSVLTSSNWVSAWVDSNEKYHLINFSNRNPASLPVRAKVGETEYLTANYRSCTPRASIQEVTKLVLNPKELPLEGLEGLELNWK